MQVHQLFIHSRRRKRVGRGVGSGRGGTSGRGTKGQKARAGARVRAGFEGGRTPLIARLPKRRGFTSPHPAAAVVNLKALAERFPAGATITRPALVRAKLIPPAARRVKVLGEGELTKALIVRGLPVSASARKKIESAGGRVEAA